MNEKNLKYKTIIFLYIYICMYECVYISFINYLFPSLFKQYPFPLQWSSQCLGKLQNCSISSGQVKVPLYPSGASNY